MTVERTKLVCGIHACNRVKDTDLACNLVRPPRVVPQALDAVADVVVPTSPQARAHTPSTPRIHPPRLSVSTPHGAYTHQKRTHRAILTGFPLFSVSSSASSCASRSMRSASLWMSRARSKPVTFFPHVVLNAARAAATARSMSAAEPVQGSIQ